jgi:hypothetical protein
VQIIKRKGMIVMHIKRDTRSQFSLPALSDVISGLPSFYEYQRTSKMNSHPGMTAVNGSKMEQASRS